MQKTNDGILIRVVNGIPCYALEEAAKRLNIHQETLRADYIKTGKIRATKFKKRWWIPETAINEFFLDPAPIKKPSEEK